MIANHHFAGFELRCVERQLIIHGRPAHLGSRAFDVLAWLVENPARTVTKEELLERVWGGHDVCETNLYVQVSALRALLGHDAIATISGFGYRWAVPEIGAQAAPH